MSQNRYDDFLGKLLVKDNELLQKFNEIKDDPEKESEADAILKDRIDRFRIAERLPMPTGYKNYISSLKDGAFYFRSLIWTKNQFAVQVSEVITRVDNVENDIKKIKEKLDIS
jgi:hypothetical protein